MTGAAGPPGEITMDYSTGISAQNMGVLLGKAYLKEMPMLPMIFDSLIAQLAASKKVQYRFYGQGGDFNFL